MLELILSAIILGFMLSLVFIGPIFFLLIETSFSRGSRHASLLDLGVISADLLCIIAAYYASTDIITLINKHPGFYIITSILIFIYGIIMMVTKTKIHLRGGEKIIDQSYIKTFFNGFFFNLFNVGVILFWLVTVISIRNQYPDPCNFILYIGIVLVTYLSIDFVKIFIAKQFHDKLTQKLANQIRCVVGVILIIFSLFIFLQSFKKFNQFEKKIEEAGKKEVKYQKIK